MKTYIFTTLSNSAETMIQILEQWITTPQGQRGMNVIREYAERMTLTKEIGDSSTGAALSFVVESLAVADENTDARSTWVDTT